MVKSIEVAGRRIGPECPCFFIAEAGVNHNGSEELARRLIDAAAEAGADAVKFQTFRAAKLAAESAPKASYQKIGAGDTQSQLEMLTALELPDDSFASLKTYCEGKGLLFLSTPFDEESANLLESLDVEAFKLPSGELTNLPFLGWVARKNRPVILSTGMARLGEVESAVAEIEATGNRSLALLHCVSSYPADPADCNLRSMDTLRQAFGYPVGFSDHTLGRDVALAAVALGASIIEKHFTLDRDLPGPDHGSSLEPDELTALIRGIRNIESALGTGRKTPAANELETAAVARRSLVAARTLRAGEILDEEALACRRPGSGLPPTFASQIVGRRVRRDLAAGEIITLENLD